SGNGSLNITGTSTNGYGVFQYANHAIRLNDNSTLNVAATTNSHAVSMAGNFLLLGSSRASFDGKSATAYGSTLTGNISVSENAVLNVAGSSNRGSMGVVIGAWNITPKMNISGNGAVNLNGNGAAGVWFGAHTDISDRGSLSIKGK